MIHDDCIGIIFSLHIYIIYTVHQISLSTSNYIKLSSFLDITGWEPYCFFSCICKCLMWCRTHCWR